MGIAVRRGPGMIGALVFGAFFCGTPPQDLSIPDVVERVAPAVVSVYSSRPVGGDDGPVVPPRGEQQSLGSGAIVSADGVILTNSHVVRGRDVRVVLADGREFVAKVAGSDAKTDVAVLRIDAKGLPVIPFGDSSKVRVGETILAVGNPLGVGQTVSRGIISAKGRAHVGITDYEDFLQTDAAINPGNSGGALVNLRGELIGLNTAIASRTGGFQGIGFAIPSNMARPVMEILLRSGKVSRGQMGILVQDLTPALVAAMPGAPKEGVLVGDVLEKSPAESAGLRRGDVVTSLDGEPVRSSSELRNGVALRGAGKDVRLRVWREGDTKEITIRLRAEPEERVAAPEEADPQSKTERGSASGLAGVRVTPATSSLLRRAGLPENLRGLFVLSTAPPASYSGLRQGDLIVEVHRKPVETVSDLRRETQARPATALLTVRRGPGRLFVAVPREAAEPPAPREENF